MAITSTSIGNYTTLLTIDAGESLGTLVSAVEAVITAKGWEVHDVSAGTNAYSYKAVNKDGSTYKYIVLDYNTSGAIIMKLYESWDSGTHTGTNLATDTDNASYNQQVDLTNGFLLNVGSHERFLWFNSLVSGVLGSPTNNGPTIVAEMARDAEFDTVVAGYPKACWITYAKFFVSAGGPLRYTRTLNNYTGTSANTRSWVSYRVCGWGYTPGNISVIPANGITPYSWYGSGKKSLHTLTGWSFHNGTSLTGNVGCNGRVYGIKVGNVLATTFLDETTLACDSDFFEDETGISTTFIYFQAYGSGFYIAIPK